MADRYALVYSELELNRLLEGFVPIFARQGISLLNPRFDVVYRLDDEGDHIAMDEASFLDFVQENDGISFQQWFEPSHDVRCCLRRIENYSVFKFFMKGCTPDEIEQIYVCLREFCANEVKAAFVFDPMGVAIDEDWDGFFLGDTAVDFANETLNLPVSMRISSQRLRQIERLPGEVNVSNDLGLVLISTPQVGWSK